MIPLCCYYVYSDKDLLRQKLSYFDVIVFFHVESKNRLVIVVRLVCNYSYD